MPTKTQNPDLADQARHSNPPSPIQTFVKPIGAISSKPNPPIHTDPNPPSTDPNHHRAQIKPQTQPSSDASLEWEREMWDERKRDFARIGRRRDRVGVRGREDWRRENWWNKKLIFSLELCYSAILKVELHCSSIAKKFAILGFSIPWCRAFWSLKCQISLTFGISIPQCLCSKPFFLTTFTFELLLLLLLLFILF